MQPCRSIDYEYSALVRHVLEHGQRRPNRTGVDTLGIFGYQYRVDLAQGFPMITTKKLHWPSIVHELLWFLRGDTNVGYLQEHGVKIWDAWADQNGDLGPVYGAQFRSWYAPTNDLVEIDRRSDTFADYEHRVPPLSPPINCDLNTSDRWAIAVDRKGKNTVYKVQHRSGYVAELRRPNWRSSKDPHFTDRFYRRLAGVGFLGHPVPHTKRLQELWANMIQRCYRTSHPEYVFYGGKGVTVSPIWHSFEMFVRTVRTVPGYANWSLGDDFQLDKDYYGSSVYGPSTCVFLSPLHNCELNGTPVEIAGEKYVSYQAWESLTGHGSWYAKKRWAAGKTYREIRPGQVMELKTSTNKLWRRKIYHDQIAQVLESIKADPYSRRHVVSAWNVADLPRMALAPCHCLFQFYVANGRLSCQLYQRSADIGIGIPFNTASYALLTHIIAAHCGLGVGEFVHSFGDAHVYVNHVDALRQQLDRTPFDAPTLGPVPVKALETYELTDFDLQNYVAHPSIKMEVAV